MRRSIPICSIASFLVVSALMLQRTMAERPAQAAPGRVISVFDEAIVTDQHQVLRGAKILYQRAEVPTKQFTLMLVTNGRNIISLDIQVTYNGEPVFKGRVPDSETASGATVVSINLDRAVTTFRSIGENARSRGDGWQPPQIEVLSGSTK